VGLPHRISDGLIQAILSASVFGRTFGSQYLRFLIFVAGGRMPCASQFHSVRGLTPRILAYTELGTSTASGAPCTFTFVTSKSFFITSRSLRPRRTS
jgi:hypothetical protein